MNYPPWAAGRHLPVLGILMPAAVRYANVPRRNGFGVETGRERTPADGRDVPAGREDKIYV